MTVQALLQDRSLSDLVAVAAQQSHGLPRLLAALLCILVGGAV